MRSFTSTASAYLKPFRIRALAKGSAPLMANQHCPSCNRTLRYVGKFFSFFSLGFGRRIQAPQAGIGACNTAGHTGSGKNEAR
jgi:hypothetical protein